MKKIVFAGLTVNHHSLYNYILNVLLENFDEVRFISKSKIVNEITVKNPKLIIQIDDRRTDLVYKTNLKLINSYENFIMDECSNLLARLANVRFKSKNKLLIIHNVNRWTGVLWKPFYTNFIDQIFKFRFKNQFNAFIVIAPNVKDYFLTREKKKPVFFLPFDYSDDILDDKLSPQHSQINILIPGTISTQRRDYKTLLSVYEDYISKHPESKIILTFLGRIYSEKDEYIADYSDKINKKYGNRIRYWEDFIPQSEFEKEIKKCDFILSNIHLQIQHQGISEYYGLSKESGIPFVAYKYNKPMIVQDKMQVFNNMDSQIIRFKDYPNLSEIFYKMDHNKIDILQLHKKVLENKQGLNNLILKETNIKVEHTLEYNHN